MIHDRATGDSLRFAPARQERLLELIRQQRFVRLGDLCRTLGVSPATVRRDLMRLEARGRIRRVHGGAVSIETRLEEPLFDDKTGLHAVEKQRIAEAAEQMVREGETVYLDGGSTVLELARRLRGRTDVTVVTNSLRVLVELAGEGPRTVFIGGELRRRSETCVGPLSRWILMELQLDRAFMGTIGLTAEGLWTTDPAEAFTKELAMQRAREVILLADHSKFGAVSVVRAGRLEQVHCIVTDRQPGPAWQRILQRAGVRWLVAGGALGVHTGFQNRGG